MSWQEHGRNFKDLSFIKPRLAQTPKPPPLAASICYESSKESEGWVLDISLGSQSLACFLYGQLPFVMVSFSHPNKIRLRISECQMLLMGIKYMTRMMLVVNREVPSGTLLEIRIEGESKGQCDVVQGTTECAFRDLQNLLAKRNNAITTIRKLQSMNCTNRSAPRVSNC